MTSNGRRVRYTQSEINSQLEQLFLLSSSSYASSSATLATAAAPASLSTTSSAAGTTASAVGAHSDAKSLVPSASAGGAGGDLDQLAPILVNIGRSHQQDAYTRSLKRFVDDKHDEIEQLCFENYQDFVASVSQLLRVRQGTVSLKHRVIELNRDVQESGKKVADKKKALLEARRVGQNIDETIDTLQACLRVLDLSTKVQSLIRDEKFFSALRQLDDMQQIHLKPVATYPFASIMLNSLPDSKTSIKDSVTKSLKAWMYDARTNSRAVGKYALETMEQRSRRWNQRKRKEYAASASPAAANGTSSAMASTMRLAKINGPVELGVSERYEYNALENDQVSIDFKPLYTCIHIYTTLDSLEELQLSYQADRRAQAYLLLSASSTTTSASSPPTAPSTASPLLPTAASMSTTTTTTGPNEAAASSDQFSLSSLSALLEEIVGFFLIESHVLRTTTNFRSEQDVEQLWEHMCDRLVEFVDKQFLNGQEDPQVFLGTKYRVLTFVQTLEGYGYSVSALHALLLTLFSRYSQLLERKFSGDFEQIVLDDDHQPMVVNDAEEFEKVASVSWLPNQGEWSRDELVKPGYPLALPFSQTYPLCCIDIRSFTEQYYQFSEGFAEHHRDIDEVLRKALDNLLICQVSENVQRRLTTVTNLSQLAQIVVNVLFFKTACQDLETLLVTLRATQRGGTIHLDSLKSFNQTLVQTQDRIVSQISLKMDSFFEEAEYPWTSLATPPPPPSNRGGGDASGYLMDLMDFVSTVMMSVLVQLPEFSKEYVYRGALKYCAMVLTSFLTDKEPRMVSDHALSCLSTDVKWLIHHVTSLGGGGGGGANDSLVEIFAELDQILNLLTNPSTPPTVYFDTQVRQSQFAKVEPKTLRSVSLKLVTFYNSSPGGSRFDPRRKLAVEDLLRGVAR